MNTYTITEVLNKFEKKEDKAYAFKGQVKGALMYVDTDNDDRMTVAYPNGKIVDSLPISLKEHIKKEEARHWVFVEEVLSNPIDGVNLLDEIIQTLNKSADSLYQNMTDEQREEAKKLLKEHGIEDKRQ